MHALHSALALFHLLQRHFGLATVFMVLFLENFGLPLPGEITLVYVGFAARRYGAFGLGEMFLVASLATASGQAGGYGVGFLAGDWVRRAFHLLPENSEWAQRFFERYGPVSVLVARFVAGLRTVIGPLAGISRMEWRTFLTFDILGAVVWVVAIGSAGAYLGVHWHRLVTLLGRLDLLLLALAAAVGVALFRHLDRGRSSRYAGAAAPE